MFLGLTILRRWPGALRHPHRSSARCPADSLPASSSTSSACNFLPEPLRPSGRRGVGRGHLRASACGACCACCWSPSRPGASRSSSWSTRSARWRAGRASSPSAAAPACRRCCAASRRSAATSPRSSRWPTTAARRASCARSWASPPVGDIRNCIAALADAEPTMTQPPPVPLPGHARPSPGLAGHAFGNLLIAALADIAGDFEEGVRLSNRVLAVRGQVVPVAPVPLTLHAELADGSAARGPVADHALARHPARLDQPGPGRGQRRRGRGHPRRRPHRHGPGQPLHEPAAEPARARHPLGPRGARAACASTSATSPRSPARPRATRSPSTSRRSAPTTSARSSTSCSPTTTTRRARPSDYPARAGPHRPARRRRRARASSWRTSSTRRTPIATTRAG